MAITKLTGVNDAAVYEPGYYPTGADVALDLQTIIDKQGEAIDQINANDTDLANEVTARAAADAQEGSDRAAADDAIWVQVDANTADIATNTAEIAANTAAINALTTLPTLNLTAVDPTLTAAQCEQNAIITTAVNGNRVTLVSEGYRNFVDDYVNPHPITFVCLGTSMEVHVSDATWADGTANTNHIELSVGECVTVIPVNLGSNGLWAICSGKSYADLTT